ncbi:3899_t:CDS:2 [Paraglomus brasilianum]|uniref:3899_t:CDS:1 n=1 Tax=Paraglomus brasilianum TaxID=144538 RepID=A0A9N9APK1_9GLOM|nr:3899_t:CDS:2 [Paraglomus brasilianum]
MSSNTHNFSQRSIDLLKESLSRDQDHQTHKDDSHHTVVTTVKEKISDAVHTTAQKLNLEPRERHPEAYHQDGKTNPDLKMEPQTQH